MILVDTNVVSEAMQSRPEPRVMDWFDTRVRKELWLSAISVAELLLGVELLPVGKRKAGLAETMRACLERWFADRILPFDRPAAEVFAPAVVKARRSGYDIGLADAQIAAIALSRGWEVASRDEAPFLAAGVPLVNPWKLE